MDFALWVGQGLLAGMFLVSGTVRLVQSGERMSAMGRTAVMVLPLPLVRVVAASELVGAVGVVLPRLMDVVPVLTPMAAVGLGIVMVGAAVLHARSREAGPVAVNLLVLAVCVFVAWGRFSG